jgi:hypothetical protein
VVLTFRVPGPNSLAGVFKIFWVPFLGFGWRFVKNTFYRVGLLTPRPNPNLKVWVITFDLSDMGVPTSSNATASIALRIISHTSPSTALKLWYLRGGARNVLHTNLVVIWLMYFYCIMATNMFRPITWLSSGWFISEKEYSYN